MENIKNNIAANIAFYRKKCKITQQELAIRLNTKNTTVSTWERGSSLPDAETLFSICQILNVSLSQLYGVDSAPGNSISVSPVERSIILEYRKADDITKAMILRILSIESQELKGDATKMA